MKKIIYMLCASLMTIQAFAQQKFATVTCEFNSLQKSDSICLFTEKYGINDLGIPGFEKTYTQKLSNHKTIFKIPVGRMPLSFHIEPIRSEVTDDQRLYSTLFNNFYYLEAGDDFHIIERNGKLTFTGFGSVKLRLANHIDSLYNRYNVNVSHANPLNYYKFALSADSGFLEKLKILKRNQHLISPAIKNLLKADIAGDYLGKFNILHYSSKTVLNQVLDSLKIYRHLIPSYILKQSQIEKLRESGYSMSYTFGIAAQYKFDSCYVMHRDYDVEKNYRDFKSSYTGVLRDRLILRLLYKYQKSTVDIAGLAQDALNYVTQKDIKDVINQLILKHKIGTEAYNFELQDTTGKIYRLSDFKGKVVMLDFWYNGCGNCRAIEPYMKAIEKKFAGKPVIFVSINIDKEKDRWIKGIRSGAYTTTDRTNLYTGGRGDKDLAIERYDVQSSGYPTLKLIDKEGKIMRNPEDPRADGGKDIINAIETAIK